MRRSTLPIVFPAVTVLGYEPIWFGIIVVQMAELCLVTSPNGLNSFVVSAVGPNIPVRTVFRGVWPSVLGGFLTVAPFLACPGIGTWLPEQMSR